MKKLVLSLAVLLGSFTTFANTNTVERNQQVLEIAVQEEYTEVAVDALPDAVKSAVATAMPGAVIEKAYTNENQEYKLEVKVGEESVTVYTDAAGTIIQK